MLLVSFLTPLAGRDLSVLFTPLGKDLSDFFTPLDVENCWTIVSFSSFCTDKVVSLAEGLNPWLLLVG